MAARNLCKNYVNTILNPNSRAESFLHANCHTYNCPYNGEGKGKCSLFEPNSGEMNNKKNQEE